MKQETCWLIAFPKGDAEVQMFIKRLETFKNEIERSTISHVASLGYDDVCVFFKRDADLAKVMRLYATFLEQFSHREAEQWWKDSYSERFLFLQKATGFYEDDLFIVDGVEFNVD